MKKTSIFTIALLRFTALILFIGCMHHGMAQKITIDEARHIAKNLMFEKGKISQDSFKASREESYEKNAEAYFYTFNLENNGGFVIVSADKKAKPILGYSLQNNISEDSHSPAFEEWMQSYVAQIEWANGNKVVQNEKIKKKWDKYEVPFEEFNALLNKSTSDVLMGISGENTILGIVGPLFGPDGDPNSIRYKQGGFYNDDCPGESLVGCVATAMSMIMVHYDYPNVGLGYREYDHSSYGQLSADFGATTYNIASLPPSISSANSEVAQLNYHAGVSVLMDYSPTGSGSSVQDIEYALITNWDYDRNLEFKFRSQHESDWESMIRTDIDNGMPVIYRGSDVGGAGGHAWICDGYDESDSTYHMNWGWGGYDNGYFTLSALLGGDYDFADNQGAIFGIKPNPSNTKSVLWEHFDVDSKFFSISPGWDMDGDGDGNGYAGYLGGYNSSYTKVGSGGKVDQWMVSPKKGLPAASDISLSFYAHRSNNFNQKIEVYISTAGTDITTDFTLVESFTVTDNWQEYVADLSAYAGQKIHVGIKSIGAHSSLSYSFIDDLLIAATPAAAMVATVSTESINDVSYTTAEANGNISNLGSPNPSAHGFCWSASPAPTIADSKIDLGAANTTGMFSSSITQLGPDTEYFVRAFATNAAGTSYGATLSFTTLAYTQTAASSSICEGDSTFLQEAWQNLPGVYIDTLGNGSIVSTTLTVNPVYVLTESINVCSGENHTFPDGTTANNITVNVSHVSNLVSLVTGCDSLVTTNVSVIEPVASTIEVQLCSGEDYTWPDGTMTSNIQANTSQTSYLTSQATGCDSTVTTNLTVTEELLTTVEVELCRGEDYTWPDGTTTSNIQANTSQTSYLTSQATGCDSTITTNVTVTEQFVTVFDVELCKGEDYTWPDGTTTSNIQANTSQTSYLTSQATGCDSTVTTNLTVTEELLATIEVELCKGEDYTWPDGTTTSNIQANTSQTSYLTSQSTGCDSTVTTNLTVTEELLTTVEVELCKGEDYTWPDGTTTSNIQANTSQTSYLTSQSTGCDSTVTTNLTVTEELLTTVEVALCKGEDYTWPDGTTTNNIQANTTHISYLTSQSTGCDSTVTTNLSVTEELLTTVEVVLCKGEDYTWPDGTTTSNIQANTSQTSYLTSQATGCDSTVTTNLTVTEELLTTVEVDLCKGEDYTWPDGTTMSNIQANTSHISYLTSQSTGCDSTVTTNLSVTEELLTTVEVALCKGENHTWPDGTTTSNIQANTSQTSYLTSQTTGCDSTVTTVVTVIQPLTTTIEVELCIGENYSWPDGTTTTNIQVNTSQISYLTSQATGCDSMVITNIAITQPSEWILEVELCKGEDYTWPDGTTTNNIQANTSHISYLTSQSTGCDSTVTTNITVIEPTVTVVEVMLCKGEDYTWPDGTTTTDISTDMSQTSYLTSQSTGCVNTIITNMTIFEPFDSTEEIKLCYGESYTFPDGTTMDFITANTSYVSYLNSEATGCNSTLTTNITINKIFAVTEEIGICPGEDYTYPDGTVATNITKNATHISDLVSTVTGCDSVVTTYVRVSEADATITADGNILTANDANADSFQWIDCNSNLPILGATSFTFDAPGSGNYALIVNNNGCRATSECISFVIAGMEDLADMVQNIWPNPTSGEVSIQLMEGMESVDVSICDNTGKVISQTRHEIDSPVLSTNVPGGSGIYYIRVESKSQSSVFKVVKQ